MGFLYQSVEKPSEPADLLGVAAVVGTRCRPRFTARSQRPIPGLGPPPLHPSGRDAGLASFEFPPQPSRDRRQPKPLARNRPISATARLGTGASTAAAASRNPWIVPG